MQDHVSAAKPVSPKKANPRSRRAPEEVTRQTHLELSTEFRLQREAAESVYEVAKEKDHTVMRLEEIKFLAISTKDLSEDDTYWINVQKQRTKDKYNLRRD
ncbi:hypothetical protein Tco_1469320 [Tanacetum coccineum]